ncbi:MAG: bifunctional phosphopantothenoylcysteine decarboxylase/phosphopantothenate--cysteine ligase CoaBC [Gammaproteobacteria bacterium]|nr:bifunctional phosphopantothenoylcysteine decarboxylase/phosphopantothenate--cysteine ligase CoaBC [Gammaproteobacteria bacterium]MCW8988362.1 bifunctional phosphopantothenoylcysteine decarboxylase/phosphopantothenate--cysteine ligase CoaBC [Gammaproteobacteria bacterium]
MQHLTNKRVLLGVTGSIAAYKAADVIRRLRDAGAEVKVVMTDGAKAFVTPLTFQALSASPVYENLLDKEAEAAMGHIELARWADVILIAPASANSLASLAQGRADELLNAICLASDVPLAVAPAMNKHMWADPATQDNVRLLAQRGVLFIGPDSGEQACGDIGEGRMIDSETIISRIAELFSVGSLSGLTVVITAGPTREALDPVRYLSNHSSGKMGYAIAEAAVEAGAKVILVSGPVSLESPDRVQRINVESAADMEAVVKEQVGAADIFVATAAVADYRPVTVQQDKIKKKEERLTIELEKNTDILATVKAEYTKTFCVGFAAETQNVETYARTKLEQKNIEMIVANLVGPLAKKTAGTFNSDLNELNVYWQGGEVKLELASKTKLARQLIALISQRFSLYKTNTDNKNNIISLKSH